MLKYSGFVGLGCIIGLWATPYVFDIVWNLPIEYIPEFVVSWAIRVCGC